MKKLCCLLTALTLALGCAATALAEEEARTAKAGKAGGTSEYEDLGEGTSEVRADHDPHSLTEMGVDSSDKAVTAGSGEGDK